MSTYSQFLPPAADAPLPPGAIAFVFNQATPGATTTDSGACVRDNAVYLQADYPDLYAMVGLVNAAAMTPRTTTTTSVFRSGTYGAGLYVFGMSASGQTLRTTDFVTWAQVSGSLSGAVQTMYFGNSLFVAANSSGGLSTSTNAVAWSARTSGTASSINGIAYGAGLYVLVGAGGMIRTSTDAITWAAATSGTTSILYAVIYENSLFVTGGAGGALLTSTDAVTWDTQSLGVAQQIECFTYGGGLYMAGFASGVRTSTDAVTWSATLSAGLTSGVAYSPDAGAFLASGSSTNNIAYTTTDGATYRTFRTGTNVVFTDVFYGNGQFVALTGVAGAVYTSVDPAVLEYSPDYDVTTEFYVPKIGTLTTITAATQNVYVRAT